jgi:CRISPR-associated protein Csm3
MNSERRKPIFGKVAIAGIMHCETGLHIGAQGSGGDIGGVDKPVVRDPITRQPYVPGTSLKGKLRSLLERALDMEFNHKGAQDIYRHECTDPTCRVCRLMGSAGREENSRKVVPVPSRLLVRDMQLTQESVSRLKKIDTGLLFTEWKFENNLDRITSAANPRQMERVPAGAEFHFEIIYTVETSNVEETQTDLTNLLNALALLEDDALGGSGSRGYGKVRFQVSTFDGRRTAFYAGQTDQRIQCTVTDRNWAAHVEPVAQYFAQ